MSLNRTTTLLVAWILAFLAAAPAFGAHPIGIADMQLFAPADMSTYGGGYRANEGFFFSFDGLLWWIGKPNESLIGDDTTRMVVITRQNPDANGDDRIDPDFTPQKVIEFSTLDTGILDTEETSGQRYQFGAVEGHQGWLCNIFHLAPQTQSIWASDVHVVFDDAPFGVPPIRHLQGPIWAIDPPLLDAEGKATLWIDDLQVKFDELFARYEVEMWGAELSYLYRMHPFHYGGILELFAGARYMELNDKFFVEGLEIVDDEEDPPIDIPHGLGDSWWDMRAENHIVGPQLGARYFRKTSRWTWSTEGRFFAGFNNQNIKQQGELGSKMNPIDVIEFALEGDLDSELKISNMAPSAFSHSRRFHEWSPAAELRVDLTYQLTRAISLGAGWTGLWIDGIARGPSMIDYSLGQDSVMGITGNNREDVFTHGFNFRVELNR